MTEYWLISLRHLNNESMTDQVGTEYSNTFHNFFSILLTKYLFIKLLDNPCPKIFKSNICMYLEILKWCNNVQVGLKMNHVYYWVSHMRYVLSCKGISTTSSREQHNYTVDLIAYCRYRYKGNVTHIFVHDKLYTLPCLRYGFGFRQKSFPMLDNLLLTVH